MRYWRRTYVKRDGTVVQGHWVNGANGGGNTPSPPPSPPPPPPATPRYPPPQANGRAAASRSRKRRRKLSIAITATVAIAAGIVTYTVTSGSSSGAGASVSLQANIDLGQAVSEITKLGFSGSDNAKNGSLNSPADCAQNSTGDVRMFLTRNQCKEYSVALLKIHKQGVATQAAISWVAMTTSGLALQYKDIVDKRLNGNPPGQPPNFSGLCYASGQNGDTAWVAQVQPTGYISVDRQILQAIAPVKLSANYLEMHCIG